MTADAPQTQSPSEIDLTIILVTFGARELALRCLHSLRRESNGKSWEVRIVDNGSPNRLVDEIVATFPEFHIFSRASNSGFAAAANLAAADARGKRLLFLNPDTVVLEGAIDRLLDFARLRPDSGIWGGRTVFADGRINPAFCRRRPTPWRLLCSSLALDTRFPESSFFGGMGYGDRLGNSEAAVDVVCGCFLLVDRNLWDRLSGFSPAFFMYGEDDDLCLRARRLGYRPRISPASTIVHHGSGSEALQVRKLAQILAARALIIRGYFLKPAVPLGLTLLLLRPCLGRWLAKPHLRKVWRNVWELRQQWLAGEFPL